MKNVCLLFLAVLLTAGPADAEDIDLFILAGQSNAQGWTSGTSYYPNDPHNLDARIRFYWSAPGLSSSNGEWKTLQLQGEFPLSYFGPEVSFARNLKRAGYNPAIFKYSRGSTSIAHHWKGPGEGGMYDQMSREFRKALALLKQGGNRVRIRGLVWIQGESDAENLHMATAYPLRLRRLIDGFRHHVARNPGLPVVLGVDEQHHKVKRHPQVVQAQQALAEGDRKIVFTSMLGLEKKDGTHLTPGGLAGHGKRLFDAYRKIGH